MDRERKGRMDRGREGGREESTERRLEGGMEGQYG